MLFLVVKAKISWIDNSSNEKSRLTTIMIPNYDDIDFNRRDKNNNSKSKLGIIQSIIKVILISTHKNY